MPAGSENDAGISGRRAKRRKGIEVGMYSMIPSLDTLAGWLTANPDSAASQAVASLGQGAIDITNSVDQSTSSLWSNLEPWVIGAAVLIGLFLIVALIHEVKGL